MKKKHSIHSRHVVILAILTMLLLSASNVAAQSPLCFTARNGTVTVRFVIRNVSHTIQYSKNGSAWSTYSSGSSVTINANQSVRFRAQTSVYTPVAYGDANTTNSSYFYFSSSDGGTVEGSGSIMSLYGPNCPDLPLRQYAFSGMFSHCTILTTPPALSASTLANNCYEYMFAGCSSLTAPPALPATSLKPYCYRNMFYGCLSIVLNTTTPGKSWTIPATTTANYALSDMFTNTGGTMNSTPSVNTIYYIESAPQYNVTAIANDTTMGFVNGSGLYYSNDIATLTPVSARHYHFARWSDGDTANPRHATVVGDTSFTAVFETNEYMVNANDLNGTVAGTGTYIYNTTATLAATPNEHCYFAGWPDGDTALTKSFTVTGDTTFTYLFAKDKHTITATCEHGTVSGAGIHEYGDYVTLTVYADEGYKFFMWSDSNLYNPRAFVVEGDFEVVALCEETPPIVEGVENVTENFPFCHVNGKIINPDARMLRIYSTEGKMILSSDTDIVTENLPGGIYMVMDENGHTLKMIVK